MVAEEGGCYHRSVSTLLVAQFTIREQGYRHDICHQPPLLPCPHPSHSCARNYIPTHAQTPPIPAFTDCNTLHLVQSITCKDGHEVERGDIADAAQETSRDGHEIVA